MDAAEQGAVLRIIREDAGLSLGALAKRVYFHKSYLCNLEKGKTGYPGGYTRLPTCTRR